MITCYCIFIAKAVSSLCLLHQEARSLPWPLLFFLCIFVFGHFFIDLSVCLVHVDCYMNLYATESSTQMISVPKYLFLV